MEWTTCDYLVVVVNYRTPQRTIDCLEELSNEVSKIPNTCVVVVDNDSQDQSCELISAHIAEREWPWAFALQAPKNGGYAFGNNYAIRQALDSDSPPDYFHLLNPDTEVRENAMVVLRDFLEENPKAGIAGGCFENPDGSLWQIAFRFPSILSEIDRGLKLGVVTKLLNEHIVPKEMGDQIEQVDWLPGASMLVRKEVYETAGLMDETYFLYYEETDFCLSAKRAGWECWYVPESRVMHIAGDSTGVTSRDVKPKRAPQYLLDSRRRYFVKNYSIFYAAIADLSWIVCFALWRLRRKIQGKQDTDPPKLLSDSVRNSVFFKRRSTP
jgi:GT2 family glycosyltransferase